MSECRQIEVAKVVKLSTAVLTLTKTILRYQLSQGESLLKHNSQVVTPNLKKDIDIWLSTFPTSVEEVIPSLQVLDHPPRTLLPFNFVPSEWSNSNLKNVRLRKKLSAFHSSSFRHSPFLCVATNC